MTGVYECIDPLLSGAASRNVEIVDCIGTQTPTGSLSSSSTLPPSPTHSPTRSVEQNSNTSTTSISQLTQSISISISSSISPPTTTPHLSLIHISEPTRLLSISYAVFCLKKKKKHKLIK
eukprot:TRINITY_DN6750_c0_g1_i12.p1 TRINITY_DN6750_c0_g1~~TRINITY_DN6750_c0_g1_i12.p1  ORF type:complete len:120 (-),score=21.42 TRINITY_DN6750_c0_g1_i12:110-469(-)